MFNQYLFVPKTVLGGYKKSQVDQAVRQRVSEYNATLSELALRLAKLEDEKTKLETTSLLIKRELIDVLDEKIPVDLVLQLLETMDDQRRENAIVHISPSVQMQEKVATAETECPPDESVTFEPQATQDSRADDQAPHSEESHSEEPHAEEPHSEEPLPEEPHIPPVVIWSDQGQTDDVDDTTPIDSDDSRTEQIQNQENTAKADGRAKLLQFLQSDNMIEQAEIQEELNTESDSSFWGIAVGEYNTLRTSNEIMNMPELVSFAAGCESSASYNSFFDTHAARHERVLHKPAIKQPELTQESVAPESEKKIISPLDKQIHTPQEESNQAIVKQSAKTTDETMTEERGVLVTECPLPVKSAPIADSHETYKNTINNKIGEQSDDAKFIRSKYIVGKIAGDDIYDSNRRLIIKRNARITAEVVERADQEGKLPDLILHMQLDNTEQ